MDSCILETVSLSDEILTLRMVVFDHDEETGAKSVCNIREIEHVLGGILWKTSDKLRVPDHCKFNNHLNRPVGKTKTATKQMERCIQTCIIEGLRLEEKARKSRTLIWEDCKCGDDVCELQYPINFGSYYQGTGFSPNEKKLLEEAFVALEEKTNASNL